MDEELIQAVQLRAFLDRTECNQESVNRFNAKSRMAILDALTFELVKKITTHMTKDGIQPFLSEPTSVMISLLGKIRSVIPSDRDGEALSSIKCVVDVDVPTSVSGFGKKFNTGVLSIATQKLDLLAKDDRKSILKHFLRPAVAKSFGKFQLPLVNFSAYDAIIGRMGTGDVKEQVDAVFELESTIRGDAAKMDIPSSEAILGAVMNTINNKDFEIEKDDVVVEVALLICEDPRLKQLVAGEGKLSLEEAMHHITENLSETWIKNWLKSFPSRRVKVANLFKSIAAELVSEHLIDVICKSHPQVRAIVNRVREIRIGMKQPSAIRLSAATFAVFRASSPTTTGSLLQTTAYGMLCATAALFDTDALKFDAKLVSELDATISVLEERRFTQIVDELGCKHASLHRTIVHAKHISFVLLCALLLVFFLFGSSTRIRLAETTSVEKLLTLDLANKSGAALICHIVQQLRAQSVSVKEVAAFGVTETYWLGVAPTSTMELICVPDIVELDVVACSVVHAECAKLAVQQVMRLVASLQHRSGSSGVAVYEHLVVDVRSDRQPLVSLWEETVTDRDVHMAWYVVGGVIFVFGSLMTLVDMIVSASWNRGSGRRLLATALQALILCFVSNALFDFKCSVGACVALGTFIFVVSVIWALRAGRSAVITRFGRRIKVFAWLIGGALWIVLGLVTYYNKRFPDNSQVGRMRSGLLSTLYLRCSAVLLGSVAPGLLLMSRYRPPATVNVFQKIAIAVLCGSGVVGSNMKLDPVVLDLVIAPDWPHFACSLIIVIIGAAIAGVACSRLTWPFPRAISAFLRCSLYPVLLWKR